MINYTSDINFVRSNIYYFLKNNNRKGKEIKSLSIERFSLFGIAKGRDYPMAEK